MGVLDTVAHMNTLLAKRLKVARIVSGLSQRSVAIELDITEKSISRHENGEQAPRADTLRGYAVLYGVSTDWLLSLGGAKGPV